MAKTRLGDLFDETDITASTKNYAEDKTLPPGKYTGVVTACSVRPTKAGDKYGLSLKLVADSGPSASESVWYRHYYSPDNDVSVRILVTLAKLAEVTKQQFTDLGDEVLLLLVGQKLRDLATRVSFSVRERDDWGGKPQANEATFITKIADDAPAATVTFKPGKVSKESNTRPKAPALGAPAGNRPAL